MSNARIGSASTVDSYKLGHTGRPTTASTIATVQSSIGSPPDSPDSDGSSELSDFDEFDIKNFGNGEFQRQPTTIIVNRDGGHLTESQLLAARQLQQPSVYDIDSDSYFGWTDDTQTKSDLNTGDGTGLQQQRPIATEQPQTQTDTPETHEHHDLNTARENSSTVSPLINTHPATHRQRFVTLFVAAGDCICINQIIKWHFRQSKGKSRNSTWTYQCDGAMVDLDKGFRPPDTVELFDATGGTGISKVRLTTR